MFKFKVRPILITTQQGIRDGEIVQVQMYVDTLDEMKNAVAKASAAIKVRKDEFQRELEEVEAAAKAKIAKAQAEKKGNSR